MVTLLCRLAATTLPVVFCFDQIEALQRNADDREAFFHFAQMAADLHDSAPSVGLITCLTFARFSAPDLALTQIVVETVTAVLILLGLRWLPRRLEFRDPRRTSMRARARRARDVTLAILCGSGVAALSFAVLTRPAASELRKHPSDAGCRSSKA